MTKRERVDTCATLAEAREVFQAAGFRCTCAHRPTVLCGRRLPHTQHFTRAACPFCVHVTHKREVVNSYSLNWRYARLAFRHLQRVHPAMPGGAR